MNAIIKKMTTAMAVWTFVMPACSRHRSLPSIRTDFISSFFLWSWIAPFHLPKSSKEEASGSTGKFNRRVGARTAIEEAPAALAEAVHPGGIPADDLGLLFLGAVSTEFIPTKPVRQSPLDRHSIFLYPDAIGEGRFACWGLAAKRQRGAARKSRTLHVAKAVK